MERHCILTFGFIWLHLILEDNICVEVPLKEIHITAEID